ncbi:DsbA family protein [Candidatus Parvarchaeota archaeon]|nr:DsbA family protein [Candidatus Parvarchaeota archaeon]
MVLCFIAAIVYAVLGIFSAKYRALATEAFGCIIRTASLRPCETDLDTRIKAGLIGRVGKVSQGAAGFLASNFKAFSWLAVFAFFAINLFLFYQLAAGVYNWYYFGNCNGPESTGFCPFNPFNTGEGGKSVISEPGDLVVQGPIDDAPLYGSPSAWITIVEFGCFSCPYTKKAFTTMQQVLDDYRGKVNVQWRFYPLPNHPTSNEAAKAAACAYMQGKFREFAPLLFEAQRNNTRENVIGYAEKAGLDKEAFVKCFDKNEVQKYLERDSAAGNFSGIYGTPTFFIGNKSYVGPQTYETFKQEIDRQLSSYSEITAAK